MTNKIRPMPEREKYQHAFEMVRLYQKHVLPFVEEYLGYEEMHNLRSIWQAAIIPIHEEDPDKEKYTQAYSNWLWMAHCSHDLLAEKLSTEEVLEYKRLLLKLYERQLDSSELLILRTIGAHTALTKALLYEMQWLTPLEMTSSQKGEVTCVTHNCKLLQTSGTERVCRVDCQNIGKAYARKVYHLKRVTILSNHGCTITLTPIAP